MIQEEYCPLCNGESAYYFEDKHRSYRSCSNCNMVFVPSRFFLTSDNEKQKYDFHNNSPDDPRYRKFLSRLFTPLSQRLPPASSGLDFGSGPGPTLSIMLEEIGHTMAIFDIFYANTPEVFDTTYDVITSTEVAEHLKSPKQELDRLWHILRPGGYLGLMTKMVKDKEAFSGWRYKSDPTHIRFFHPDSFIWLADQWNATVEFIANDVIIFQKSPISDNSSTSA